MNPFQKIYLLKIPMSVWSKWNKSLKNQDPLMWTQCNFQNSWFQKHPHMRACTHTHTHTVCTPLNPPGPTSCFCILCEASFCPGSMHQRGDPTVLAESSRWSLTLGTHAHTHSLAHGPCLFSCLLIFGKLNKRGELAGDNQLVWDCRDENHVSGVPKSPPVCLKHIKRTLDPGYQRVQKDQEELKLMVCQKPPVTEGHYSSR